MSMNFAAIADHYYLMERENRELKASKQRLMTALAGATATVLQMEGEYDALKAVEAAARGRRGRNCTCKPSSGCFAAVAEQAVIDALAALDAIRTQEVAR